MKAFAYRFYTYHIYLCCMQNEMIPYSVLYWMEGLSYDWAKDGRFCPRKTISQSESYHISSI
jgi:hypothetical protein